MGENMNKITYAMELSGVAPNTSDKDLKTEKFRDNQVFCLQRVAVTDETTGTKTATVGLNMGDNIMWLESITIGTANRYYALTQPVYINTCRGVVVRFHSPTTNDKLHAFIYGYFMD